MDNSIKEMLSSYENLSYKLNLELRKIELSKVETQAQLDICARVIENLKNILKDNKNV